MSKVWSISLCLYLTGCSDFFAKSDESPIKRIGIIDGCFLYRIPGSGYGPSYFTTCNSVIPKDAPMKQINVK